MKQVMSNMLIAGTFALLTAQVNAQVVNLDARTVTTSSPLTLLLAAGNYQVFDVGPTDVAGAVYAAWNPWGGPVGGCDAAGANCSYGWYRQWYFDFGAGGVSSGNAGFFSTAAAALAASKNNDPLTFNLSSPTMIKLWIADYPYWDNTGGVSLNITTALSAPIPEPETYAMLLAGLGLLGFTARHRKRGALRSREATSCRADTYVESFQTFP